MSLLVDYPVYSLIRASYEVGDVYLVVNSPTVTECAAYQFAQALVENAVMLAGRLNSLKAQIHQVCRGVNASECALCDAFALSDLDNSVQILLERAAEVYQLFNEKYKMQITSRCKSVIEYTHQMAKLKRIIHSRYIFFSGE